MNKQYGLANPPGRWEKFKSRLRPLIRSLVDNFRIGHDAKPMNDENVAEPLNDLDEEGRGQGRTEDSEPSNTTTDAEHTAGRPGYPFEPASADVERDAGQDASRRRRRHAWTQKHGFFGTMGGFGLHIPPLPDDIRFLPKVDDEAHFIITAAGLQFIADFPEAIDNIPDISVEEIDARGRASWLEKLIVCGQACWFIAQCITRLANGLPISLLELNTLAHAVCVLLTYFFWWVSRSKPWIYGP